MLSLLLGYGGHYSEGGLHIYESRNRMWVIRKGNKWGKNDQKEYYTHV